MLNTSLRMHQLLSRTSKLSKKPWDDPWRPVVTKSVPKSGCSDIYIYIHIWLFVIERFRTNVSDPESCSIARRWIQDHTWPNVICVYPPTHSRAHPCWLKSGVHQYLPILQTSTSHYCNTLRPRNSPILQTAIFLHCRVHLAFGLNWRIVGRYVQSTVHWQILQNICKK